MSQSDVVVVGASAGPGHQLRGQQRLRHNSQAPLAAAPGTSGTAGGRGVAGQGTAFLIDLTTAADTTTAAASCDDDVIITQVKLGRPVPRPVPKRPRPSPAKPAKVVPPPPPEPAHKCPVCLEAIEQMVATPCGHVFCEGCLSQCLKVRRQCPKCRKNCDPRRIHRIYLN